MAAKSIRSVSTAEQARKEAKRAKFMGRPLPKQHPYAVIPTWVPFWVARLLSPVVNRL